MSCSDEYYITRFGITYLKQNPKIYERLLNFYCKIWMFDPNFAEYRRCPVCHKFYSIAQVVSEKQKTCSGQVKKHEEAFLQPGWTPEIVKEQLQPLLQLGDDFFGALALAKYTNQVRGFVWGYSIKFDLLSKNWQPELIENLNKQLPCTKVAYFQEIASDPNHRGVGIGSSLCYQLVSWMKDRYPDQPSMLHTHQSSPAYNLFVKAGYHLFFRTDQVNSGRIFLIANSCSQLTPNRLLR